MTRAEREAIGNLLAVLHGDGGHYMEKHGIEKAVNDAAKLMHVKWVTNEHLTDINQVIAENKELKEDLLAVQKGLLKVVKKHIKH